MPARPRGGARYLALRAALFLVGAVAGLLVGVVATFAHQSMPPLGVILALVTSTVFLVGLRLAAPSRAAVVGAVAALLGVTALLSLPSLGGSLVVPANPVGYTWLIGVMVVGAVVATWPRTQRPPRRQAASMGESPRGKESVAP